MSTYRIVVLASGSGTLLQALIDAQGTHEFEIVGLITDGECAALTRASDARIATKILSLGTNRDAWDELMAQTLHEFEPDLVVSAGFMRILGDQVLHDWLGKIINTHPAMLPLFPGAHAVRDAMAAGVATTGTTVHFIDAGVDTGEVIVQREVDVYPHDTEHSLHERIKLVERGLIVEVVKKFARGELSTKPKRVIAP